VKKKKKKAAAPAMEAKKEAEVAQAEKPKTNAELEKKANAMLKKVNAKNRKNQDLSYTKFWDMVEANQISEVTKAENPRPSGNIQGTFRGHSVNIKTRFSLNPQFTVPSLAGGGTRNCSHLISNRSSPVSVEKHESQALLYFPTKHQGKFLPDCTLDP
jgi:hypothetical protein